MIPVLLINLDRSKDRLNFQKNQLEKLQIPMHRLAAVECSDFTVSEYEMLANKWQRKLRRAEVGCFLSHKNAWQHVLNTNKPWLILEDDALLSKQVPDIRKVLGHEYSEKDYVNLETRYRRKWLGKKSIDLIPDYQLRRLYQDRNGSAAYVLYPSGARKLLDRAEKFGPALADAFLSQSYELDAWQIYPAAAIQMDQCENYNLDLMLPFTSTIASINDTRPMANNRIQYWIFKIRRIVAQIRMGWRQISVYKKGKHSYVPILKSDFENQFNLE